MRRRVVPLLLALAAAVAAVMRRRRRGGPSAAPRYVEQPTVPVLRPPSAPGDGEIAGREGDSDIAPDPQVEGEAQSEAVGAGRLALHNLAAASPGSPFRSVAWELLDGEPAADATELRIGFSLLGRYESLARVDVRETASQVFVTVLARFDPPAGGWFAYADAHQATISLQEPLGERALVHAPADEPGPPPSPPPPADEPGSPPPPAGA